MLMRTAVRRAGRSPIIIGIYPDWSWVWVNYASDIQHRTPAPEIREVGMISRSDLDRGFSQLKADVMRLADEDDRLRRINAQMLAALRYSLPVLQEGLPEAVNFDRIREAVAKIQSAIAEAERDA